MEQLSQTKNVSSKYLKKNMLPVLVDLKENYGVVGVKAEFEAEGATFEEVKILKDLVNKAGISLTLKIGGCEAITDIMEAKKLDADTITAPMIETPFAMKKFVSTINSVFSQAEAEKTKFLINIETITGYNNFSDILASDDFKILNGVVLGRGDMAGSLSLTREDVNTEQILNIALSMSEKIESKNKYFYVGGGVSVKSLSFFKKLPYLTGFQTRKIIFGSEALSRSDTDKGILKAIGFELLWLKNKYELSLATKRDEARIAMLSKYNDLIESIGRNFT